jgi:hypothetical protein
MRMFSIPTKTGNNAGTGPAVSIILTLIKPIEFKPDECASLPRKPGNKFSKELV